MAQTLAKRLEEIYAQYESTNVDHYRRMDAFVQRIGQLHRRVQPGN